MIFAAPPAGAQEQGSATSAVFQTVADAVVQVRVVENDSKAKAAAGSGFFVDAAGLIISNYHVVSKAVFNPASFGIEIRRVDGTTAPARLVTIDVINDLAVLKADLVPPMYIEVNTGGIEKGERLFSLGNPRDMGFTIVEGSYSGLVEDSLYERIHFTGSLNGGMSGGPTVTRDRRLAGVNVATSGNQISFLIPSRFVSELLERVRQPAPKSRQTLVDLARQQLLANQQAQVSKLLARPFATVSLGEYTVPSQVIPALKCWSESQTRKAELYNFITHQCSLGSSIFVDSSLSTGDIQLYHSVFSSEDLNRFQFYDFLETTMEKYNKAGGMTEEEGTSFRCTSDFVDTNGASLRAVFCVRGYKKLSDLFDLIVVAASLNRNTSGLLTYFRATGLSFESSQKLGGAFLGSIGWKPH